MADTNEIRQAIARAWCNPLNASKEMDADLAEAAVVEVMTVLNSTPQPADAALADARAQKPVAYMHNKRADVIHTSVKSLLSDFAVNSGPESMLRPIDKSEHYTIPLYAAPVPPQPSAVPEAVAKDAARYRWLRDNAKQGAVRTLLPLTRCHYVIVNESAYDYPKFDEAIDAAILSATDDEVKK